jgi:hypothetical protein
MLVCRVCGSQSVSRAVWVDANDDTVIEECGCPAWCWHCSSDATLIDDVEYANRAALLASEARADLARDER